MEHDEAVCRCESGYAGDLCEECSPGYHQEHGECVEDEVCEQGSCSGNGDCDDSSGVVVCECHEGYEGSRCEECASGYQDNDGDGVCRPGCSIQGCNGHGVCDDSSGEAVCACDEGWIGSRCSEELDWVEMPGGTFMMGSNDGDPEEQPVHLVTVPTFRMLRTEVTVAQYGACVDDGMCTEPDRYGSFYNWRLSYRENHPVNCVDWYQARDFCLWIGASLPSEAEWEYAARGGGQDITYPWGDDPASCDYAVICEDGYGCGMNSTWPVCSKTLGNSAQGLCDMAGNIFEWVQDCYHPDYEGAPDDGSAWETEDCTTRVLRGGCLGYGVYFLRSARRWVFDAIFRSDFNGFRCSAR